jgi:hypothetical protein
MAQSAAQLLEANLLNIGASSFDLNRWQALNIKPLLDEYEGLQSQAQELDAETAVLYMEK